MEIEGRLSKDGKGHHVPPGEMQREDCPGQRPVQALGEGASAPGLVAQALPVILPADSRGQW